MILDTRRKCARCGPIAFGFWCNATLATAAEAPSWIHQRLMKLNVDVRRFEVIRGNFVMFTVVPDRMFDKGWMK